MAKTDKHNISLPKNLTPEIKSEMKSTGRTKSGLIAYILKLYFDKKSK